MKKLFIFLIANLILIDFAFSQNGISVNTTETAADNSAILDISSTSQGLLIPRLTTTQRNNIASPSISLLIFNTTTNCFEAYVNGSWYSVSCEHGCKTVTSGCGGLSSMTDIRDSKVYKIVQIGTQCWMGENLNYGTFVGIHTGVQAAGEKYCQNLGVDDASCPMGGLYQWVNLMNGSSACNGDSVSPPCCKPVQGLCAAGWHIPSHFEWVFLERSVCSSGNCGSEFRYDTIPHGCCMGTEEGSKLKEDGTTHWGSPNNCNPPGSCNSSGFTALPGGYFVDGYFFYNKYDGVWWTSSKWDATNVWFRQLDYLKTGVLEGYSDLTQKRGYSVRCVKD
jgi:uncharacterized protein (TIGR02145 family)